MIAYQMDTTMDNQSFDLQSTHVSFEERRWLSKQLTHYKLLEILNPIFNLQKLIRGSSQISCIPKLSSLSMIAEVQLPDQHILYYSSLLNGTTNSTIDQFRLYHQQMFHLVFADMSKHQYFHILIRIIEGIIFYSSETVKDYKALIKHEMNRCLSSFHSYIQSRSTKIMNSLSLLTKLSLSCYTMISINKINNVGLLFQILPKIQYNKTPKEEYNSIMAVGEYTKHIISPEELRLIDYTVNKKKSSISCICQKPASTPAKFCFPTFTIGPITKNGLSGKNITILHSLPIVYPYDDNKVYGQKYPLFWKGNNHKNENSNVLFEAIPIDPKSDEYTFVHRLFHQTIPENNRRIVVIERIENPTLWEKFCAHRSFMRRKNEINNVNETWLFHGTKSDNHHNIITQGFNRSYCKDYVLFGRGVYFSRYSIYSMAYGDRQDLSFLFLCRVLVGYHTLGKNDIHVPPTISTSSGKAIQADSTTNSIDQFDIVCTFHDDQNYPEYMIAFMTK